MPSTTDEIEKIGRDLLSGVTTDGATLYKEIGEGIAVYAAKKKAGDPAADRVLRSLVAQAKAAPHLLGIQGQTAIRRVGEAVLEWAMRAARL
jgi:hypothetical protein